MPIGSDNYKLLFDFYDVEDDWANSFVCLVDRRYSRGQPLKVLSVLKILQEVVEDAV